MAIVEGLMVWLLLTCGFSIDLPSDAFAMPKINTSVYESYEPEPIDNFKTCIVELNTSINRSERVDYWTCYDYSVDFAKNNPNWDMVTISKDVNFQRHVYGNGVHQGSHLLCYHFYDNTTMIVYDGLLDNMYYINNWQWDMDYYHFWLDDQQPVRNYGYLVDNRDVVM